MPSILAIVALMVGGCGASPGTSTPSAPDPIDAPPVETSAAVTPPASFPAPLPSPDGCPDLTADIATPSAHFDVWTPIGGFFLGLDVTRVASNGNPEDFVELQGGEAYLDNPLRLVGGWQIGLDPDRDMGTPITLLEASATFMIDGRDPVPVEGVVGIVPRTERPGFLLQVPDVKAAVVDVSVQWSDACFTYRAEKTWGVQMVRAAFAARCPSDHDGFAVYWDGLLSPPVAAGGIPVPMIRTSTVGLWTPYAVASQGNVGFGLWDPASGSAAGTTGATVRVGDGDGDLRLESLSTEFFRRRDILDWRDGGDWPDRDRIVFRATAEPYPDGHLELLLPGRPGRYVASLSFAWTSPCAYGDGVGAVAIDVE